MSDPAALLAAIDADCAALDKAGKALGEIITDLGDAEIRYGDRYDEEIALLVEEYEGKRLPGEDVRRAVVHRRCPDVREMHREVRRLERRKEALEAWGRKTEKALSGRQSELSFLRAEGQAPAGPQPQWSERRAA